MPATYNCGEVMNDMRRKLEEMENRELRDLARDRGVRMYEVAEELGMSPYSLSRWLRVPVTTMQDELIKNAIKNVYNQKRPK